MRRRERSAAVDTQNGAIGYFKCHSNIGVGCGDVATASPSFAFLQFNAMYGVKGNRRRKREVVGGLSLNKICQCVGKVANELLGRNEVYN